MESRRRVLWLVLMGVVGVVAVAALTAATSQSPGGTTALDVQVVGYQQSLSGYLYVVVHDAAGPVTVLREQNIRMECLNYPYRDHDEPPDDGDSLNIHEESLRNLGDGVYEIKLSTNTPEMSNAGWRDDTNYVVKVYVDGPGLKGTGVCVFHSYP